MGKKVHLTFQKGYLIFGGGASAPYASPQKRHWLESLFNEVEGLGPAALLKSDSSTGVFFVNFAKQFFSEQHW